MSDRGDFPSLQRSVTSIVTAMQAEETNTSQLAASVLGDFALTQKVIRLANSAMYAPFGSNVTTVSRAIMILGVDTVGHLALGLKLLEGFGEIAAAREDMAKELARATLAGIFAREITMASGIRHGEEAVVCTLMHHVARLLVVFYFPDEWRQIQRESRRWKLSESAACAAVLGVSFAELAEAAARRWGLPVPIANSMKPFDSAQASSPLHHNDWLSAIASLSNEVVGQLSASPDEEAIAHIAARYADAVAIAPATLVDAGMALIGDAAHADIVAITTGKPLPRQQVAGKPLDAGKRLADGLREVQAAAAQADSQGLVQLVLEAMMQSLGFSHCVAFVHNPRSRAFEAQYGIGGMLQERLSALRFGAGFEPDVFHLSLSNGRAIFIENAQEPRIARRLPAWYCQYLGNVRSFFLLPVTHQGQAVALLYGDWGTAPCTGGIGARELEFLHRMSEEISHSIEMRSPSDIAAPPSQSTGRNIGQ